MANQSYKEVVRAKLAELIMAHRAEMGDECFEELCALVNAECLRSFKNGLAAGKSRTDRPRWQSANIKGTALENGRLRPAPQKNERELVVEEGE